MLSAICSVPDDDAALIADAVVDALTRVAPPTTDPSAHFTIDETGAVSDHRPYLTPLTGGNNPPVDEQTHDAPFTVQQYANNDTDGNGIHQVHIDLTAHTWRNVVGDIARAMWSAVNDGQPVVAKLVAAGRPENDADRVHALGRLVALLEPYQPRRSWSLTPEQALMVAALLDDAAQEPSSCEGCGLLIEQPSQLNVLTGCAACYARQHGEGS